MDALILSCGTGGGHNSAGKAVLDELNKRGHNAVMINPYSLCKLKVESKINNTYISVAKSMPKFFGFIYKIADIYRRLPVKSPVYYLNRLMTDTMREYLDNNHVDIIITPHLFPAEIITGMKKKDLSVPLTMFIATDYTCIPFTEETECDRYIIPSEDLLKEYVKKGIPREHIYTLGIPCHTDFSSDIPKQTAKKELNLETGKKYILISGGSMGAGNVRLAVKTLYKYYYNNSNIHFIVICGNNEKLYSFLNMHYKDKVYALKYTEDMAKYMKACDIFISKPGGLSSTEALVSGIPLIHISPIPGCETANMNYFNEHHLSLPVKNIRKELVYATRTLLSDNTYKEIKSININATKDICDMCERLMQQKTPNGN